MNALATNPPTAGPTPGERPPERVAFCYLAAPIGTCNFSTLYLLMHAVQNGFTRDQIQFGQIAGCPQPYACYLSWEVTDRAAALRSLRRTLQDQLGIMPLSGIAYWCQAEGYWRHIFGNPFVFEKLFTDDLVDAARQQLIDLEAVNATFLTALQAKLAQEETP